MSFQLPTGEWATFSPQPLEAQHPWFAPAYPVGQGWYAEPCFPGNPPVNSGWVLEPILPVPPQGPAACSARVSLQVGVEMPAGQPTAQADPPFLTQPAGDGGYWSLEPIVQPAAAFGPPLPPPPPPPNVGLAMPAAAGGGGGYWTLEPIAGCAPVAPAAPFGYCATAPGIQATAAQISMANGSAISDRQKMKPGDDDKDRFYWVRELDGQWSQRSRRMIEEKEFGPFTWHAMDGRFYAVRDIA